MDLDAYAGDGWALELGTAVQSLVRENRLDESVVRISPRTVAYGAVARLRLGQGGWSLFALHRSQHDVDSDDAAGNRETISYEIYGVRWLGRGDDDGWGLGVTGGLYYDRGTTLDGVAQTLPFDHYLGGLGAHGMWGLTERWYGAASVELVAHRDADHAPVAYLNTGGHVELGLRFVGKAAELRVGLTLRRIEDPLHLGDPARHMLMLTTSAGRGVRRL